MFIDLSLLGSLFPVTRSSDIEIVLLGLKWLPPESSSLNNRDWWVKVESISFPIFRQDLESFSTVYRNWVCKFDQSGPSLMRWHSSRAVWKTIEELMRSFYSDSSFRSDFARLVNRFRPIISSSNDSFAVWSKSFHPLQSTNNPATLSCFRWRSQSCTIRQSSSTHHRWASTQSSLSCIICKINFHWNGAKHVRWIR